MDKDETNTGVRYERKDIRLRGLLILMAGAACFTAILYFAIWRFFWWQESVQEAIKESPYPMAPRMSTQMPPKPRLEQLDRMAGVKSSDVDKSLAAKEKALDSYGPTADKGFVHIPIQQAIKAVAGKLPVRKQPQPPPADQSGLLEGGQSSSGRMFRGPLP
jgi:hypothetical protein